MSSLLQINQRLARELDALTFAPPVTHVYNPLQYASETYERYLERFGRKRGRVALVGMNPGPFGMMQTGVPFGDVSFVRDWMGIHGKVEAPPRQHPQRPILGFACERGEVSGARLWGWAKTRFEHPEGFFARFFVLNYCPLVFLEESGRNRTPDKLPAAEKQALFEICDRALGDALDVLKPKLVVGIGAFAHQRAKAVLRGQSVPVGTILHPSPASPLANRGWQEIAEGQLRELGAL